MLLTQDLLDTTLAGMNIPFNQWFQSKLKEFGMTQADVIRNSGEGAVIRLVKSIRAHFYSSPSFADRQQNSAIVFPAPAARRPNCGHVAKGLKVDILEVVVIDEVPAVSTSYVPTRWALAVAAELERLKHTGVRAALVHLEDSPRVRSVGISRPIDL